MCRVEFSALNNPMCRAEFSTELFYVKGGMFRAVMGGLTAERVTYDAFYDIKNFHPPSLSNHAI